MSRSASVGTVVGAFVEPLERRVLLATITGTVFHDLNGNGVADDGEGLPGRVVYLDANGNGVHDQRQIVSSTSPNRVIPDPGTLYSSVGGVGRTIGQRLLDLNVTVNITHPFDSDLQISLIPARYPDPNNPNAPPPAVLLLADRLGGIFQNYTNTTFDDEAQTPITLTTPPFTGRFRPMNPLSSLYQFDTSTLTLQVTDLVAKDTGVLNNWSAELTAGEPEAVTDQNGRYTFTGIEAWSYKVRELPFDRDPYHQTVPASGFCDGTVFAEQTLIGLDFGEELPEDAVGLTAAPGAAYEVTDSPTVPGGKVLRVTGGPVTFHRDIGNAYPGLQVEASDGATLLLDATQHLGSLSLSGGASAVLESVTADAAARTAADHRVLVTGALNIDTAWGSRLDLADNDLVLKGGQAGGLDTIQSLIGSGYAKAKWNGPGIVSSAAAGKTSSALGYALNDGSVVKATTTFGPGNAPEAVGPTDVLVKYTWEGDSNLDGVVSFDDYFYIDSKYPKATGSTWTTGDFDYNAQTSFDDYFYIDSNYPKNTAP